MRVLFLDIDGVLNSTAFFKRRAWAQASGEEGMALEFGASQIDPAAVEILDQIVDGTGCEIVICSSWRHLYRPNEIEEMLEERGFEHGARIIGETPTTGEELHERGTEIRAWLALERERWEVDETRELVESYCILDDTPEFDGDQLEHYVQPDRRVGLTQEDAKRVIEILQRPDGPHI